MNVRQLSIFAMCLLAAVSQVALASDAPPPKPTLISNVNIFDGKSDKLQQGMHLLIKDNLIETISDEPLAVIQTDNVTMIDVGGRTLIPGLIDAHWHTSYCCAAQSTVAGSGTPRPHRGGVRR